MLTELKKHKTETEKTEHTLKNKILHLTYRTPEEILKVRVQKFLECRGYLPEAKSLCKVPLEDTSSKKIKRL